MASLIEVQELAKVYHVGEMEIPALQDVSLSIEKGEFVAIMGASGSGKSTFMNILGFLDRPTSGRYLLENVDGMNLSRDELAEIRNRKIGFVFQGFNLLARTSALENVELPLIYGKAPASRRKESAQKALTTVGLQGREHHHPNQLSGGQQQRVAIARALVNDPSIVLADEPTGNLDSKTSVEIMDIFQRLNSDLGITIIMITHEPDIAAYAKRKIHFKDGRVMSDQKNLSPIVAGEEEEELMTALFVSLRLSLKALRVNKMRSALTMLGIIIGVGAVIAMIAIGSGAKKRIADQIASMGSNLIIVLSGSSTSGGLRGGSGTVPTLTSDDAKAIQTEIPAVKYTAPNLPGTAQVVFGNQNWSTVINGTNPEFLQIREWVLASGRSLTQQDLDGATKVCLLGKTVADNLFGGIDPVGQVIRIKNVPFTVIGVLDRKGQSAGGQDQDDTILVPLTTSQKRLFGTAFPGMVRAIAVQATGPEVMKEAEEQITTLLRQRHHIQANQDNDFTVRNLTEVMASAEQSASVMSLLLGAIASISLIVGGIGIMNIMLVSVTERTREIGIRIAVGAKSKDILQQFLIESLVLSMVGGLIGIGSGVVGTLLLSRFTQWPTLFSIEAILLAFVFSGSVGVFFGFYPARKASLMNPIEALRYE